MVEQLTSDYPEKRFSLITCKCGFEIPVVPDVKMLGKAIDEHIEEHRAKEPDDDKGEVAAKRIHDYLFSQLFKKIGNMTQRTANI